MDAIGRTVNQAKMPASRLLEPVDRVSEVLFGLIMVLTSTGTLSVLTAGRADVKTMILGALGCNLAWGIIDAGIHLMGVLDERGRNFLMVRAARHDADSNEARSLIEKQLPAQRYFFRRHRVVARNRHRFVRWQLLR